MDLKEAIEIIRCGIDAASPERAVINNVFIDGDALVVCGDRFELQKYERILVVGAGKASERMASAIEKVLGDRLSAGVVITKKRMGLTERIEVLEGSHPLPDERSLNATMRIMDVVSHCGLKDLVIILVSGGGSSLLCCPLVSLESFRSVTERLMKAGAGIKELNTVRKKLSAVKGGKLAALIKGDAIALIMSDVVGDSLEHIASGPTVNDTGTNADALKILKKYGIALDEEVLRCLSSEANKVKSRARNYLIATNGIALNAMSDEVERRGYNALILSPFFEGEATQLGHFLSAVARGIEMKRPACVICGGEAIVHVRGSGRGGPNMEIAASFAINTRDAKVSIACAASDGEDGSTYAAGAFADHTTLSKAEALGLNIKDYLENNDTLSFFERVGSLIVTGSTGTNVNSFWLIFMKE
jgi:glycerate-2-kinase